MQFDPQLVWFCIQGIEDTNTSRSLLPCLWLPPDALSLDAPWCWSSSFPTEPTFSFMRLMLPGISLFRYWIKFFVIWALSWVNLDGDLSSLWGRWRDVWCPTVSPRADRLNRSQVINWSNQLGSFSTQFWLEGRGKDRNMIEKLLN